MGFSMAMLNNQRVYLGIFIKAKDWIPNWTKWG
jgi:hypothetical protein